jgi:hypothetical protein
MVWNLLDLFGRIRDLASKHYSVFNVVGIVDIFHEWVIIDRVGTDLVRLHEVLVQIRIVHGNDGDAGFGRGIHNRLPKVPAKKQICSLATS